MGFFRDKIVPYWEAFRNCFNASGERCSVVAWRGRLSI